MTKRFLGLESIMTSLPLLSHEQREDIISKCLTLNGERKEANAELYRTTTKDAGLELLYHVAMSTAKNVTRQTFPPLAVFLKNSSKGKSVLASSKREADSLIASILKREPTRKELTRFYSLIALVVVQFLKKHNIPVSGITILSQYSRFASLLDQSLPSYSDSPALFTAVLARFNGKGIVNP